MVEHDTCPAGPLIDRYAAFRIRHIGPDEPGGYRGATEQTNEKYSVKHRNYFRRITFGAPSAKNLCHNNTNDPQRQKPMSKLIYGGFVVLLAVSLTGVLPAAAQNSALGRDMQAEQFVRDYLATEAGATALDDLRKFYGDLTDMDGAETSFDAIYASRKELNTAWPKRRYTINPATIYVHCSDEVALCTVEGTVGFVFEDSMQRRQGSFEIASGIFFGPEPKFTFLLTHQLDVDQDLIRGSGEPAPMATAPIPAPHSKGKKCMVFNGQQFCN